ncbi:MAG: PAS domain S-box protein [Thermodesulfovibrionia bacterium]|nr:PAS domain S-box protein [Thermodesulfovibrionia bacterium]
MKDDNRTKKEPANEGHELYRNLFHYSNDGIFIHDLEGNILDVNQKAADQLGYSRQDILSLNISSLHPAESLHLLKSALKAIYSDGSARLVIDFKKKDGGLFPAEVSSGLFNVDGDILIHGVIRDISARREVEDKLRNSEMMFRAFFDRSTTGIIIYPIVKDPLKEQLKFADFNSAFHDFFGYTRAEIEGKSVDDISHPDDMIDNTGLMNDLLAGRRSGYQMEKRYFKKGGEIIWGLVNVTTLRDPYGNNSHVMTTLLDITQRKKVKEALIAERNFSKSIINSLPDIFFCFDAAGKFLLWNENYEKVSGYSSDEISKMNVFDFFTGKEKKLIFEKIKEVFEHGRSTVEANLVLKNEKRVPYYFTGLRTEIEGKTYLLGTGMDISNRKRMEEELRGLSLSDELTGLYNRRGFMTLAEQELRIARRMKRGVILLYADLDDLKVINDGFGHIEGDNMLKDTARFLQELFRESDIIARIGGDEFVVFSIQTTDTSVDTIQSRFDACLKDFNQKRNQPYMLSISIGIVHYKEDCPDSIEALLTQADKLMYEHKRDKHKGKGG